MSHLPYYIYPGFGEKAKIDFKFSQAVRIGDTIECSGQGGWNRDTGEVPKDLAEEVARAFENVDVAVKAAGGAGWADVYSVRTYSCASPEQNIMQLTYDQMLKYCPNHEPLSTFVGVQHLAMPGMRLEIEVKAKVKG